MNASVRRALPAPLSFAGVLTAGELFGDFFSDIEFTNSFLSVFLFLALLFTLNAAFSAKYAFSGRRHIFFSGVFSFFLTCALVFGRQLESGDTGVFFGVSVAVSILVWTVIFSVFIRFLWEKIYARMILKQRTEDFRGAGSAGNGSLSEVKSPAADAFIFVRGKKVPVFFISFAVLFVCYFMVLLGVYPGFFAYDATEQLTMVETGSFDTHHPIFHTLLLGGVIRVLYKLTASHNVSIAGYFICQLVFCALVFAWILTELYKENKSKKLFCVFLIYFSLFPVILMYVLCSVKDSLFSVCLTLFVFCLRKLFLNPKAFFSSKVYVFMYFMSAVLSMLFRNNAPYAFAVFAVMVIAFVKCFPKRKVFAFFVLPILVFLVCDTGLFKVTGAVRFGAQETLTVPIMQLARVYNFEDELEEEDKKAIEEYLPDGALQAYTPRLSDGVKYYFSNERFSENHLEFVELWFKLFLKYPLDYLNAWLYTSYGFWYPDALINVYEGHVLYTFTYEDSSYFAYETELPGVRESKIPFIDEFMRKLSLEIYQQRVPVVSMLFSPGFMFWVFAFVCVFFVYVGRGKRVWPYFLVFLVWLTFLLGPTYLVRYAVYFWFLLPVAVSEFWAEGKDSVISF